MSTNIVDYDSLQAAIAEWLARDDVGARIPDFIAFAERQLSRDMRTNEMLERQTLTTIAGQRFYPMPDRYIEMRDFHIETGLGTHRLFFESPQAIDTKDNSAPGCPRFYSIHGNEFEMQPTPDDAYQIEMTFYQAPLPLSASNTTNVFVLNYPDILLYASMLQAEAFIMEDDRINLWVRAYDGLVAQENRQEKKGRYGASPAMTPSTRVVV